MVDGRYLGLSGNLSLVDKRLPMLRSRVTRKFKYIMVPVYKRVAGRRNTTLVRLAVI
jgi:hypothetical protein